ncbi:hypothetical protein M011DRAFT_513537 [Sporormia fimetaria CBS 119925]|uniref:Uncharacterized protein n=1 Tax=Sporormia fimetaria CBS 119925 TaxID=1340428 RepID=A0A6A6VIG5_9PLEO|nr:hypothetical protein M011DRAFT_513537 [Sporormia fimetaria CBS 119925]
MPQQQQHQPRPSRFTENLDLTTAVYPPNHPLHNPSLLFPLPLSAPSSITSISISLPVRPGAPAPSSPSPEPPRSCLPAPTLTLPSLAAKAWKLSTSTMNTLTGLVDPNVVRKGKKGMGEAKVCGHGEWDCGKGCECKGEGEGEMCMSFVSVSTWDDGTGNEGGGGEGGEGYDGDDEAEGVGEEGGIARMGRNAHGHAYYQRYVPIKPNSSVTKCVK